MNFADIVFIFKEIFINFLYLISKFQHANPSDEAYKYYISILDKRPTLQRTGSKVSIEEYKATICALVEYGYLDAASQIRTFIDEKTMLGRSITQEENCMLWNEFYKKKHAVPDAHRTEGCFV